MHRSVDVNVPAFSMVLWQIGDDKWSDIFVFVVT